MARKKTENPSMPVTETATELRIVRLELPAAYHKRLRVLAAELDTPMAILARKVMMEYIDNSTKKGGAK
jgi:hypothetical protein